MDAKMLSQLIEGYERCTPPFLPPVVLVALKEYRDLLAAMEGSTDEIVRELRDIPHGFDRNSSHTEDRYVCMCEHLADKAAAALVAMKAERDAERKLRELGWSALDCPACGSHLAGKMDNYASLKQHAEAMKAVLDNAERIAWEVGSETVDGVNTLLEDGRGDLYRRISAVTDAYRAAHPKEGKK